MRDARYAGHPAPDHVDVHPGIAPGKRTLTQSMPPAAAAVQARATGEVAGPRAPADDPFWFATGQVQAVAADGVAGASAPLPHLDTVQRSFGRHDVTGIRAEVGGAAGEAATTIGAAAYATGDRVGFAQAPDLHTAAHEAAHVVQQRAGVQLKGGVGEVGDVYERHADEVADLVVRGESAEAALDAHAGGGGGGGDVQCKMVFLPGTEYLDIDGAGAGIALDGYQGTLREAIDMPNAINVRAGVPKVGTACYTPNPLELSGDLMIQPIGPLDIQNQTQAYNSRLIAMAHETRHGVDDLTKTVRYRNNDDNKIRTEWRAFATQSAVAWQLCNENKPVEQRYQLDIAAYASRQAFMNPLSRMVKTTQSYMLLYGMHQNPQVSDVIDFMNLHLDWVDDAIALFDSLKPPAIPMQAAQQLRPDGVDEASWTDLLKAAGWVVGAVATAFVVKALGSYFGLFG